MIYLSSNRKQQTRTIRKRSIFITPRSSKNKKPGSTPKSYISIVQVQLLYLKLYMMAVFVVNEEITSRAVRVVKILKFPEPLREFAICLVYRFQH